MHEAPSWATRTPRRRARLPALLAPPPVLLPVLPPMPPAPVGTRSHGGLESASAANTENAEENAEEDVDANAEVDAEVLAAELASRSNGRAGGGESSRR